MNEFASHRADLEHDQELRDQIRVIVRDLEQKALDILTIAQKIHQADGIKRLGEICGQAKEVFALVRVDYGNLAKLIPENEYFRYNDHFRFVNQRLAFLAALIKYLETEKLISLEETAQMLGTKSCRREGFHLDLDDYLMSLLTLASELARFSVNCVTGGYYDRPLKVSEFLANLDAGFRLLNLKNDSLRKRFDALKYDVKKVEEVVYDLSIRGLKSRREEGPTAQAGPSAE